MKVRVVMVFFVFLDLLRGLTHCLPALPSLIISLFTCCYISKQSCFCDRMTNGGGLVSVCVFVCMCVCRSVLSNHPNTHAHALLEEITDM